MTAEKRFVSATGDPLTRELFNRANQLIRESTEVVRQTRSLLRDSERLMRASEALHDTIGAETPDPPTPH